MQKCNTPATLLRDLWRYQAYETRKAPSSLVLILREYAWIPQKGGRFVRPHEASKDQLPAGFPFDASEEWLKAILFGKSALPFTLDDGSHYFEMVEFLRELKRRHYQNYLALCPDHAAMFQYANGSRDLLKTMFLKMDDQELQVILAREDETIYFTKTHIADLRAVIGADEN